MVKTTTGNKVSSKCSQIVWNMTVLGKKAKKKVWFSTQKSWFVQKTDFLGQKGPKLVWFSLKVWIWPNWAEMIFKIGAYYIFG